MKLPSLPCLAIAAGCCVASGQANSPPTPRTWLSIPTAQLRSVGREVDPLGEAASGLVAAFDNPSAPATDSTATSNQSGDRSQDQMSLESYSGEFDYRTYRLLHENAFLKRAKPESGDLFSRVVANIFEPEVFRIGQTAVCCSVVTAINRKNPLCLLNPLVLNISW
jgi:hypothetical protein